MRRSDSWLIVITGIISGVLLLAGGISATYHYTGFVSVLALQILPPNVVYPYAAYSLKLLVAGAILSLEDLALCLASPPTQTAHGPRTVKQQSPILLVSLSKNGNWCPRAIRKRGKR